MWDAPREAGFDWVAPRSMAACRVQAWDGRANLKEVREQDLKYSALQSIESFLAILHAIACWNEKGFRKMK